MAGQQNSSSFRAETKVVLVPVSVRTSVRLVAGLTAADFELLDQGVRQTVTVRTVEELPIDVTLVLDTSGSVQGRALEQFKSSVRQISESLQVNDRVRLLTFAANVSDASGLQSGGVALEVNHIEGGGATSFYNALAAAVVAFPLGDRLQFIFAFSDGVDNSSFQDPDLLRSLIVRSGAVMYLYLPRRPLGTSGFGQALRDAVARSGGTVHGVAVGSGLPDAFERALADFRTSYVLSYTPTGVGPSGWHDIVVRTKNSHTVRHRSGYNAE